MKGRKINEKALNEINSDVLVQVSFKTSPKLKKLIIDEAKMRESTISEVMNDILCLYMDNEMMIKTYKDSVAEFIKSQYKTENIEKATTIFIQIFDKNRKNRGV